ncbi:hypothetical protein BDD21_5262 [Thiocapsa rosea]|uniref:Uncharacterized protein n=1 Tax=Thiocapsa rosea TaxID=69360 RepID=A0A495VIH0_9GAMM|nr:hypothetical protein BDD21_5262 [Thiocapsa rosea]
MRYGALHYPKTGKKARDTAGRYTEIVPAMHTQAGQSVTKLTRIKSNTHRRPASCDA